MMDIKIGSFDPETRRVRVIFSSDGVDHDREVNACLDAKGKYDAAATAERVDQVAAGVERKIKVGAIVNPPPAPAPADDAPTA